MQQRTQRRVHAVRVRVGVRVRVRVRLLAAGCMLESRRADRACLVRVSVAAELGLRVSKVRSEYYGARLQLESREVQADAVQG